VDEWTWTPCVAGIDIARKTDSTVVTVVWVDWDRPDEFGYYEHRILDWYEIHGDRWEEQYFQVVTFLNKYKIFAVAVDGQGIGDVFAERLGLLMPGIDVHAPGSSNKDQGERWSHLMALLQRKRPDGTPMLAWPGSKAAKKLRRWKR